MSYGKMSDLQSWIDTLENIINEMQDVDEGEFTVALEYIAQGVEQLEQIDD
ncbi:MAG: hypothetical protein JXR12_06160 [Neptunomonas phycophila]|uniref:hypothetical protein n=1 Tax=Neptunomonas phycophila TaxID=1572645 RepID=UPI003B8CEE9A